MDTMNLIFMQTQQGHFIAVASLSASLFDESLMSIEANLNFGNLSLNLDLLLRKRSSSTKKIKSFLLLNVIENPFSEEDYFLVIYILEIAYHLNPHEPHKKREEKKTLMCSHEHDGKRRVAYSRKIIN
jgi:hypothetical protein